jgi:phage-related minor tail protein
MLDKENERLKQKVDEMTKTIETLKKNLNHLRAHSRKARDEKS